eukprot:Skav206437  [mRNA]  locus=scaffold295:112287:117326:+ [translate_table: standard]
MAAPSGARALAKVFRGRLAALRFLLDEKLPSAPDVDGRTLMHEAANGGHLEVLQELQRRGFDATVADFQGRPVAQDAAESSSLEVLKQVKRWGADLSRIKRVPFLSPEVREYLDSSELCSTSSAMGKFRLLDLVKPCMCILPEVSTPDRRTHGGGGGDPPRGAP